MNSRLLRPLAALALLASAPPVLAAEPARRPDIELFSLENRLFPELELDDPTPGSLEENARIQPSTTRIRLALPWRRRTDRSMFAVSLGYERLDLALDGWPDAEPFPNGPFHSVQFPMTYARTLRDGRDGLRCFLTPGFSSDFHDTGWRGFRAQGGVLYERKRPGGTLSAGLVLINDYGVPRVLPAIAWQGQVAERQTVVVRLPVQLSWAYEAAPTVEWGVAARVAGGNYEIGRPDVFERKQLKYSAGTVGPFIRKSFGPWSIGAEAGYVFLHSLEVRDRRHQFRDYDLERSAFLSAALRLTL